MALTLAPLRYRKLHTLRHTFASLLIRAGAPETCVQEQFGHHSAAFTLTMYSHFVPRTHHRGVDRLDDVTARNPGARAQSSSDGPACVPVKAPAGVVGWPPPPGESLDGDGPVPAPESA